MNPQKLLEYVDAQWQQEIIPSLSEYIKIPNKSPNFDSHWHANGYMDEAVSHVYKWCEAHAPKDMHIETLRIEGRTPLLFIEIPGQIDETILMYGHLDKQPEMTGWKAGLAPWKPVLRNGRLYGRGSADDGYAVYAAITAIRALQAQNKPHARCVLIIEMSEESGSCDLPAYIENYQGRIGKPNLIICLDSGAGNYDQLWMTTSLRGNIVGELSVELISEGVHSGDASGIVADSFRVARQLLSRLEDEQSGQILPSELHCSIPETRIKEAQECARILGEDIYKQFPWHPHVQPVNSELEELVLNRTWRPALTVTGAEGLPAIELAGNVLRPKTVLKLSMRLPPLINTQQAVDTISKTLTEDSPYHAKIGFHIEDSAMGWHAPLMESWLSKAVDEASMTYYQQPAAYMGEGGSIPFMAMLGERFPKAQFMITGVLGPESNAHGPNEFLHLDMVKKLTSCVSFVISRHFDEYA